MIRDLKQLCTTNILSVLINRTLLNNQGKKIKVNGKYEA